MYIADANFLPDTSQVYFKRSQKNRKTLGKGMRVFSSLILIPHSYYFKNHLVGVGVRGRPRETIWLKAFGLPVILTLELAV